MKIVVKLSPPVRAGSTNLATVVTPNGARSEITFGW